VARQDLFDQRRAGARHAEDEDRIGDWQPRRPFREEFARVRALDRRTRAVLSPAGSRMVPRRSALPCA
jgi:hypothetical protein